MTENVYKILKDNLNKVNSNMLELSEQYQDNNESNDDSKIIESTDVRLSADGIWK